MRELVLPPGRGQTPPPVDLEVFSPEKPGVLFSQLVGVGGSASLGVVLLISGFLHNLVTCSSFGLCGWLVKHAGAQRRPALWDVSVLEEEQEESRPRCCPDFIPPARAQRSGGGARVQQSVQLLMWAESRAGLFALCSFRVQMKSGSYSFLGAPCPLWEGLLCKHEQ